mgnify:CR=1 FL=1
MRYYKYNIFNNKVNMSNFEESIEYIKNNNSENIYYGLCDKIKLFGSKKTIELDVEKILGKNNLRNIQSLRLKHNMLITEINNLNRINTLLVIIIIIIVILFVII